MIKIRRAECPPCLNKTKDKFKPGDYSETEVKSALMGMQYGKCCYCEKSIRDLGPTEKGVDHYVPQNDCKDTRGRMQWHKANRWENLLYACASCNRAKSAHSPFGEGGVRQIIDPSLDDDDPEDHISFAIIGPVINFIPKNGSALGNSTIRKLKLFSRKELVRKFRII